MGSCEQKRGFPTLLNGVHKVKRGSHNRSQEHTVPAHARQAAEARNLALIGERSPALFDALVNLLAEALVLDFQACGELTGNSPPQTDRKD